MLVGNAYLLLVRLRKIEDDCFEYVFFLRPEGIRDEFPESGEQPDAAQAGLFLYLSVYGVFFFFSWLHVPLGQVPIRPAVFLAHGGIVEQQILGLSLLKTKYDCSRGLFLWHIFQFFNFLRNFARGRVFATSCASAHPLRAWAIPYRSTAKCSLR